jgi:hypothetical protein
VFIGDYAHEAPPADMIETAIRARLWIAQYLGKSELPYTGHQDWFSTECPGDWWPSQRGILERLDEPNEPPPPDESGNQPAPDNSVADLINWKGYIQGDWANEMQGEIDALITTTEAMNSKAKGFAEFKQKVLDGLKQGMIPRMNKLRE